MWKKYKIDDNVIYNSRIGSSILWLEKSKNIWSYAIDKTNSDSTGTDSLQSAKKLPDDFEWQGHLGSDASSIHILPAMPDRAVVVKPDKNLAILNGTTIEVFLLIPVWLRIYASSVKDENLLLEFPTTDLSSTWFGAPDNGELAYSLPANALFDTIGLTDSANSTAICPVKINNESGAVLNFERLSVPAPQLNLYSKENQLFTNEIRLKYKGEDNQNEVQIINGSPSIAEGSTHLSSARIKDSKGLFQRSFYLIKSFTQY